MAMIDVMDLKQGDQIISVRAFRPEVGWEGDPYVSPTRIFLSGTKLSFDSYTVHRGAEEPILDPVCRTGASIILYGLASIVTVGLVSLVLGLASNFF